MTVDRLTQIAAQLPAPDAWHRFAQAFNSMNAPLIASPEWSYLAVSLVRVLTVAMLALAIHRAARLVRTMRRTHPPVTFLTLLEYGGLERWARAVTAILLGGGVIVACLVGQILAGQVEGSPLGHLTAYLLIIYAGLMLLCLGVGLGCGLLTEVVRSEARRRRLT